MQPIPKYLKDINTKIQEKIFLLKKPRSVVYETQQLYYDAVLAVYQEAFNELIKCTGISSQLLNNIRDAYDNAVQIRDDRIAQYKTQDKLFGISAKKKQRDEKMKALMKEIEELKEQNLKLTFDISKQKKEMGKMKDEQFSEYLSLMRERDARYTLYFENVALQLKLKELDGSSYTVEQAYGDPVVLRIALDRCREQLSSTQTELKKLTEEYTDTVPRREFDVLEARHADTCKELGRARGELTALQDSCHKMQAKNKCLEEELSESKERCHELERAGTPRPHWHIAADFISGGRDRWYQLSAGLSSQETLLALLKELGPAAESEHLEYFDGLGTDPSVAAYLRWSGRVRNLRLSRRELCVLVHDIWRGKEARRHLPMGDYLALYFEERYQQPSMRAEWAYNLCAGAEQMLDEPSVSILWGALHGLQAETTYWALREQWRALRDALQLVARDKETVTVEEFERVCKATFPLKSDVDVRSLCEVARRQLKLRGNNNELWLDKLFEENSEGFLRLDTCRELARQRAAAHARYVRELLAALGGRRARDTMIAVPALQRAIAIVDPAIDHIRMEQYVRAAYGDAHTALGALPPAPLHALARRLAAADVERVGPRYAHRQHRTK